MEKVLIPKELNICGRIFKVTEDEDSYNSSFNFLDNSIVVGTKYPEDNQTPTLQGLVHEISEIIHIILGQRFQDTYNDSYLFLCNHNGFQSHCEILVDTLISNKILKF